MTRVTPSSLAMTAALGLAILSGVVLSTVRAAAPAGPEPDSPGAPLQVALAPTEPAKELPPSPIELKLSVAPERWIQGQPIKLHLEATNKSAAPLQIAWGLVDVGVTFEIYDAAGKAVTKGIGHSLRALPTKEQVARLFPVLQPGETRKFEVDGQWGSQPGVLFLSFMMGHMAWRLDDKAPYTMRAVLNQKELPKEGRFEAQDERLWWKGTTASPAIALKLAPAPSPDAAEKDGLSVSVRSRRPTFVEEQPLEFVVTFKNVSKADFTFLHTPANYLDWKFHFRNVETETQWQAVNTAKREGFSNEPLVLKAGESLDVDVKLDSGFLFSHVGPKDGTFKSRNDLMAGKYQMSIKYVGHGATAFRSAVKLPPFWMGELTTKPVSFAVEEWDPKEDEKRRVLRGAQAGPAAKDWMATLTVRGGNLGNAAVTYSVVVKGGKAKASENRMPDPALGEAPTQRETVMTDEALARLERSFEKLNAWQLADFSQPQLDAPAYTLVLTREGKSRTVNIEGASGSERHLATILAIEQCLPPR